MAISDICKFEVKKEVDACVKNGMSRNEASKWLAGVFSEAIGKTISNHTIRSKDQRARKDVDANASTKSDNHSKTEEISGNRSLGGEVLSYQREPEDNGAPEEVVEERNQETNNKPISKNDRGGKRKGSGRPKKEDIYTAEFESAYEEFYKQVQIAKLGKWQHTSKEACLNRIEITLNLINI